MGISRTTFYKYFRDCYDIVEQVFKDEILNPIDVMLQNGLDNRTVVENWYLSFYKRREFYTYAIRDDSQNSLFATIIHSLQDYNRRLFSSSLSGEDLEYLSYLSPPARRCSPANGFWTACGSATAKLPATT